MIAETQNPIQDLAPDQLYARAEAMIDTIVDAFTLPPSEIERRIRAVADQKIRQPAMARASTAV